MMLDELLVTPVMILTTCLFAGDAACISYYVYHIY